MIASGEKQAGLAGKSVWIIDDEIIRVLTKPEVAHLKDDNMVEGTRPIDRGTLVALLHDADWNDSDPVKALCRQVVNEAENVAAFAQPGAAVSHLERGAPIPDVIIYDLVYDYYPRSMNALDPLERILRSCVSVVQVYAQDPDISKERLDELCARFPTRLQPAVQKVGTDARKLAEIIGKKLETSLSARLAQNIRRLSSTAVEDVLVRIDDLPLSLAVELLAGRDEEVLDEAALVELLSVKAADAIKSAPKLVEAVAQYASSKGVPPERVNRFVEETVGILVAHVRGRIQYDGWLLDAIKSAWATANRQLNVGDDEQNKKIVQEFFAFRVYDQPGDKLVRTGDIVLLPSERETREGESPDLYMIVTPPCDLAFFWYKTRGILTLARMCPRTENQGIKQFKSYEHTDHLDSSSITAKNPMVLPSIPLSKDRRADYMLFVHEIKYIKFDGYPLVSQLESGGRRKRFKRHLSYNELEDLGHKLERKCRVSEPFLAGILAELGAQLFRAGVPDFPESEKNRLKV